VNNGKIFGKDYKLKKRGVIVKINQKICFIVVFIFAVTTICLGFLHPFNGNIDIMMIFVGLTTLSGGLSQINMAQQTDLKGISKGNKIVGIFSVIVGIVIIISLIIKMIT
jgi:FtsH-binding integral membrane protein